MVSWLELAGRRIELDADGCLCRLDDWDEEVAAALAAAEGIELSPQHWQVILAARDFYQEYSLAPANRALVSYLAQRFGSQIGNSAHLNLLFAGRAARLAGKIAGLPKPANCF